MRLFVAADLPTTLRARVAREVMAPLRDAVGDASWVREDALHLTLRFVGERSEAVAEALGAALREVARGAAPVPATLRGVGAFPKLSRPRVLWLGVEAPALLPLQAEVERRVRALGMEAEPRAFQPHLTLARLRPPAAARPHPALPARARAIAFHATVQLETLSLMHSTLTPAGARYRPLVTARLGEG